MAVAAILSMGQGGQELQPRFDVVRARAFVVVAGGDEVAILDADGLKYFEGQQPVTFLGKRHLNLGGIDLAVTETGDAYLTVGREPNRRLELHSASLGTDTNIEGQTVLAPPPQSGQGPPSAASTPAAVGTPVSVTYRNVETDGLTVKEINLLNENGVKVARLSAGPIQNGIQGINVETFRIETNAELYAPNIQLRNLDRSQSTSARYRKFVFSGKLGAPLRSSDSP